MDTLQNSFAFMTIEDAPNFIKTLKAMDRTTLNTLDESQIPRRLRRFIHEERIRRKLEAEYEIAVLGAETNRQIIQTQNGIDTLTGILAQTYIDHIPTGGGGGEMPINNPAPEASSSQSRSTAASTSKPGNKNRQPRKTQCESNTPCQTKGKGKTKPGNIQSERRNSKPVPNTKPKKSSKSKRQNDKQPQTQLPDEETYCLFPDLHYLIQDELPVANLGFNLNDDEKGMLSDVDLSNFGTLNCTMCKKEWISGYIATTVRLYGDNTYNARVYYQRCRKCDIAIKPELDIFAYQERVSSRLKEWLGYHVYRRRSRSETIRITRPHVQDLCEGCKVGHCAYPKSISNYD